MKISILCSDDRHPVYPYLQEWAEKMGKAHQVSLAQKNAQLEGGDILFLISTTEIVKKHVRDKYKISLVIHASDLPKGRGWSPHIWQILEGKKSIVVTLLEAGDKVDSGDIWLKKEMILEDHELFDEINEKLFKIETELMDLAVKEYGKIKPIKQKDSEPTYYPKRTSEDSSIDISRPLAEQFDLLRVADPDRFPAFFDFRGHRYQLNIEKADRKK